MNICRYYLCCKQPITFVRLFAIAAVVALMLLSSGCSNVRDSAKHESNEKLGLSDIEDQLGIKINSIRLSASDTMIDFRYRCIDPKKTEILFSRQIKPYLLHEASGTKFLVPNPPKVGPMRQTTNKPIAGKQYFMIFANPGRYIKAGEKVAIVFGDFKIEHLIVE